MLATRWHSGADLGRIVVLRDEHCEEMQLDEKLTPHPAPAFVG